MRVKPPHIFKEIRLLYLNFILEFLNLWGVAPLALFSKA